MRTLLFPSGSSANPTPARAPARVTKTKFEKQKSISWIVNAAELQIVKSKFSYEYVRVELMYPS